MTRSGPVKHRGIGDGTCLAGLAEDRLKRVLVSDSDDFRVDAWSGSAATEALLFGRRTWQATAAAWPDRAGSASLAAQLIAHGLVDEFRLMIERSCSVGASGCFPMTATPGHSSSFRQHRPRPAS